MSTITWPQAVEISDIPGVHEALQTFSEDATEDNAVCVILAVAKALATPAQAQQSEIDMLTDPGCALEIAEQARQSGPAKPLFGTKIAAHKWAELQEDGARMQSIVFDGHRSGQPGTIDPWGVVLWDQAQQSEPLITPGAVSGVVDAQIRDQWPTKAQRAGEVVALGDLAKRNVFDAIREAYDLGYNDARNARAVPGDSAPGYAGRDVESDHGGALFNTLNRRLATTPPAPAQPAAPPTKVANPYSGVGQVSEGWCRANPGLAAMAINRLSAWLNELQQDQAAGPPPNPASTAEGR